MVSTPSVAVLTGPTASGKTALALKFAREFTRSSSVSLEIINADSLQVYRELDIGTAKPTPEELSEVPHHLVNCRNPDEPYTSGDFRRDVERTLAEIHGRGARALIVGGTGFYLKALTHGLWQAPKAPSALRLELEALENTALFDQLQERDPASARRIGPADRYRLVRALELIRTTGMTVAELERSHRPDPVAPLHLLVVDRAPEELNDRIAQRTQEMLRLGLLEETRSALARYGPVRPLGAVGYAQCLRHLRGEKPPGRDLGPGLAGLGDEIQLATRQLVKKQRTWFRGLEGAEHFKLSDQEPQLLRRLAGLYSAPSSE